MTASTDIIIPGIAGDGSLFPIEKLQAHRDAVFHLAISVFVFDGPHLLIQQRASSKYHCGGLWANTCCSHPNWDEPVEACATRRLGEELGISIPLERRRTLEYSADVGGGLHEHERVTMFVANVDRTTLALDPDPDEVMATRWVTPDELACEVSAQPQRFTPWFRLYLQRYPDLSFSSL
ncbi:isopentenyl-diphosphate delta-isomerase [Stappia stellulata]|uniref:isopentenyl-diphosphate delta-isomerase n=1 Tax=Stappia stellulata TaxID=71235 RepID=UPI000419082F|nr:isopentenyl-diphosphate delta-isomerase [Stappia stellulata]